MTEQGLAASPHRGNIIAREPQGKGPASLVTKQCKSEQPACPIGHPSEYMTLMVTSGAGKVTEAGGLPCWQQRRRWDALGKQTGWAEEEP